MKDDTKSAEGLSWKSRKYDRKTSRFIKMKVFQYTPTKEDISHLLADFLVDFLLNGNRKTAHKRSNVYQFHFG